MKTEMILAMGNLVAAVPDPGRGKEPPGSEQFTTVLGWVAWVVFALCVLGVLITAGALAVQNRRGQAGEHAASLGWICAACVIAASASAIVGVFVGG